VSLLFGVQLERDPLIYSRGGQTAVRELHAAL